MTVEGLGNKRTIFMTMASMVKTTITTIISPDDKSPYGLMTTPTNQHFKVKITSTCTGSLDTAFL